MTKKNLHLQQKDETSAISTNSEYFEVDVVSKIIL